MPVFTKEHDAGPVGELVLDHPLGLLGDVALDLLAFAIEHVELLGGLVAKLLVFAEHQLHRQSGVGQTTAGVDARPETE